MANKDFYCIGCGQILQTQNAIKLFRTGFYNITYPLGICRDCNHIEQGQEPYLPETFTPIPEQSTSL